VTYRLLLLTRYCRNGASSRVRHYNYVPALKRAGFDVTIAPFFDEAYIEALYNGRRPSIGKVVKAYGNRVRQLLRSKHYDLLWIEKEAVPWIPAAWERALLARRAYVVDYDDAWYLRYAHHSRALIRHAIGRKLDDLAKHARLVVAGNSAIAEWAGSAGARRVIEMPSPVDLAHYPALPCPDGPFTVGWIGTPVTAKYLALVAEPLRRLQAGHDAKVLVIGARDDFSLPGVTIERVPWREDSEAADLARCHVGIAPLHDGLWERGKCGYKIIQYMAATRATVASPVGANSRIVAHGQTGYLASTPQEWTDSLCALASDRALTGSFGANARRRVEELYSLHAATAKMIEALRQAAGSDAGPRSS
jgi:glycosyltransferase involved in cell wall biosynthesis